MFVEDCTGDKETTYYLSLTFCWNDGRVILLVGVEAVVDETFLQLTMSLKQYVLDDEGSKDHHKHYVVQPRVQQPVYE